MASISRRLRNLRVEPGFSPVTSVIEAVMLGVASGLVASLVWWFLLFRLKPKIHISPAIARTIAPDGTVEFRIKIVNMGRRAAFDVETHVYLDTIEKTKEPKKVNRKLDRLDVQGAKNFFLHRYDKRDQDGRYARKLLIKTDLDSAWKDDAHSIVFRIFPKDGVSGAVWQDEKIYPTLSCIETGSSPGVNLSTWATTSVEKGWSTPSGAATYLPNA
jgi:hypothetical protein